jgi:hypothetical protein
MLKQLSSQSPEGTQMGASALDKIGFHGRIPVAQRATPTQGVVGPSAGGMVVTYTQCFSTIVAIAAASAAEQALAVGTVPGWGPLATDFLAAVNKPSGQAGLGYHVGRLSAACTLSIVYSNPTAANLTPTTNEDYNIVTIRGLPIITAALTPLPVPADSSSEQIFTIAPTAATATATIDSSGKVADIRVTNGGAGYFFPPSVVITGGNVTPTEMSGTYTGTGADPSLPGQVTNPSGSGATGEAIVVAGVVVGVRITNQGSGYTVAPTVTFVGGNNITPGMALMVTKPTTNVGLAIGNCRVSGNNEIAITYVNPTAAVVTPTTPETYSIMALNSVPAMSNILIYGVNTDTSITTVVAGSQVLATALAVNGLLADDFLVGLQKPEDADLAATGRVSGANALTIQLSNPTNTTQTPATSVFYGVATFRQSPAAPFVVFKQLLTPVAVAANTCAEQGFTVTPIPAGATVIVNKPTHQPGLGIAGVRVSAANTIQINYENVTAAAITPTPEVYTIGVFTTPGPGTITAGAAGFIPGHWAASVLRPSLIQGIDLVNELQETMANQGLIRG